MFEGISHNEKSFFLLDLLLTIIWDFSKTLVCSESGGRLLKILLDKAETLLEDENFDLMYFSSLPFFSLSNYFRSRQSFIPFIKLYSYFPIN